MVAKYETTLAVRVAIIVSACVQLFICAATLFAQQPPTPHGVPPPLPNTPDTPRVRDTTPRIKRGADRPARNGLATWGEIRKDYLKIQILNLELMESVAANPALHYKYISDKASKIKTLAGRLNSNLALGKSQTEERPPEFDFNDELLRSSLLTLHRLVIRFVDNPIFRERGVFDIPQTKKAKQDVDGIMALSDQIKMIAKRLGKSAAK